MCDLQSQSADNTDPVKRMQRSLSSLARQPEDAIKNILAAIRSKMKLVPLECDHITLNLDNHHIPEKLVLCICATIVANNENYHNRHMTTTHKQTPVSTMRRKKIHSEFDTLISQYYFNLTKLSLKRTALTQRSLEALSQSLRHNYSIQELDLGGNELMSTGLAVLTSGLRWNKSVTRLNISDVQAFDEGAFMIAAFLMTTKTLHTVDLSSNHITDRGFESLKQAALRNTTITSLYLEDNIIGHANIASLNYLLKRNECVQHAFETIFNGIRFNRKFKSRLDNMRRGTQSRASAIVNATPGGGGSNTTGTTTTGTPMPQDGSQPTFRFTSIKKPPPEQTLSNRYIVGISETIGKRQTMEDRMVAYGRYRGMDNCELYCVFDGHGGKTASDFAADNIYRIFGEYLESTQSPDKSFQLSYQSIHNQISAWPFIGTTAVSVYIKDNHMCVANVGDSRVVMGSLNSNNKIVTDRLTFDHRPVEESERMRIMNSGGNVLNGRVNGMLAVSRALGDSFLNPYVTCEPHLRNLILSDKNLFLILACDGVWDMVSDEEAVELVYKNLADPTKASQKLRDLAYEQGSTDNISVMVVKLSQ
ncbi:hypothetical protein SAMD00019534_095770 [Acytostelium subglobosum LB1]|uniref:hypothetical protein n=1 Tax=Acytostelium subglobosum LB1 TaxID=1410327 RepID=UPI000644DCE2|nr:hypothetical protein SAMD00019534_095770 [Acytostelium subglobosum LB1]GAM26402.1 hypothetical protein SAMD00019534_095770 [Acytostelium subglobosum LB1]|eukprot:XP_012750498.1 hypothetical protein SAMD00019534_095770 [Acytostelium subglobosum LB1]